MQAASVAPIERRRNPGGLYCRTVHENTAWNSHRQYVRGKPLRLTGDEQKAVSTTALKLPLNRVNPHINFHKLRTRQVRRVGSEVRLISARNVGVAAVIIILMEVFSTDNLWPCAGPRYVS